MIFNHFSNAILVNSRPFNELKNDFVNMGGKKDVFLHNKCEMESEAMWGQVWNYPCWTVADRGLRSFV